MQFTLADFICNSSIEDRDKKRTQMRTSFGMGSGVLYKWIDFGFNR